MLDDHPVNIGTAEEISKVVNARLDGNAIIFGADKTIINQHIPGTHNINPVIPIIIRHYLQIPVGDMPGGKGGTAPVPAFCNNNAFYQNIFALVDFNGPLLALGIKTVIKYAPAQDFDIPCLVGHEVPSHHRTAFNVNGLVVADEDFPGRMDFPPFKPDNVFVFPVGNILFRWVGEQKQRPFDIPVDLNAQVLGFINRKPQLVAIQLSMYVPAFGTDIET
jgi:hypothetical protein